MTRNTPFTDWFLMEQYDERLQAALGVQVTSFTPSNERVPLPVYNRFGKLLQHTIISGAVHRYGIIHKTADVILVSPDRHLLLQRRTIDAPVCPESFGLSAGGHFEEGDSSPLAVAIRELQEELGLSIDDEHRFHPLHWSKWGIPLFYKEWSDEANRMKFIFRQFLPNGPITTVCDNTHRRGVSSPADKSLEPAWQQTTPSQHQSPVVHSLRVFNQELTYYYVLFVTKSEITRLKPNPMEVTSLHYASLAFLRGIASDPAETTDTLSCLRLGSVFPRLRDLMDRYSPNASTVFGFSRTPTEGGRP